MFGTAATTHSPAMFFCAVAMMKLDEVRATPEIFTEDFGARTVPATVLVPLLLNWALPTTLSAVPFELSVKTPVPLLAAPATP